MKNKASSEISDLLKLPLRVVVFYAQLGNDAGQYVPRLTI